MKLDAPFRIPALDEIHTINSLIDQYPQFVTIEGKRVRLTLPDEPGFYQWSISQYAAESASKRLAALHEQARQIAAAYAMQEHYDQEAAKHEASDRF